MNNVKQIDMIRKRNTELVKQLDDLKFQLEFNSQLNMNGYRHAKDLINDLEKIKQDWLLALDDLNNKRMEYSELISDLRKIKNIMTDNGSNFSEKKKLIKNLKNN